MRQAVRPELRAWLRVTALMLPEQRLSPLQPEVAWYLLDLGPVHM